MPTSPYIEKLREKLGAALLLLPGVAAVVHDEEGRILLHRREDTGDWSLPAGSIDPGEAPAQAIVREVWEETGLRVKPEVILGVYGGPHFRIRYPNGDVVEYVAIVFRCRIVGGTLGTKDGESTDIRFFPRNEIPIMEAPFPRRLFLPECSEPARFDWKDEWLNVGE
jgi:8-oxo-dGTP pyrophosphatase MutT (NUDIX family)